MLHKKVILFSLFLILSSQSAGAAYVATLLGPKSESFTQTNQSQRTRLNPVSLFLEFGFKLKPRFYLSLGASGEFDVGDFTTAGFTLAAFVKYFFIGVPDLVKTSGKDARLELALPYTVFAGAGLFQKQIKFDGDKKLINIDTSVGGLGLVFGGSYNLSERYFLVSQMQYLVSGPSTDNAYSSIEVYGGLGFRF